MIRWSGWAKENLLKTSEFYRASGQRPEPHSPRPIWGPVFQVGLIGLLGLLAIFIPLPGFTLGQQLTLGIFVVAAGFWMTEAIPPFATAILVISAEVFLLGRPGGALGLGESGLEESYRIFLNPIASPIIILFFGGFTLAAAAKKYGFDQLLAQALLKPLGNRPSVFLLGVIFITGILSMFMSNTATCLMMIAILTPVAQRIDEHDPFRKCLFLSVAFSANIGGVGTIIGTPPNAVAASVLASIGEPINFLQWMYFGVPLALGLLVFLWVLMLKLYRPRNQNLDISIEGKVKKSRALYIVMIVFAACIALWVSEPLHGIPSGVVALIPVTAFTMFGMIREEDLKKMDWDILLLLAGGLALGVGMQRSGLSEKLVSFIPLDFVSVFFVLAGMAVATLVLSNFMSNTAASNMMIPMIVVVAGISPVMGAFAVAVSASLAMSLPISTPPNAIVYSTRSIQSKDLVSTGSLISIVSISCLLLLLWVIITFY
ncbi:MAG: DASS family sodium-coupled anion symporter [Verrucomicrobiota bacterium]